MKTFEGIVLFCLVKYFIYFRDREGKARGKEERERDKQTPHGV